MKQGLMFILWTDQLSTRAYRNITHSCWILKIIKTWTMSTKYADKVSQWGWCMKNMVVNKFDTTSPVGNIPGLTSSLFQTTTNSNAKIHSIEYWVIKSIKLKKNLKFWHLHCSKSEKTKMISLIFWAVADLTATVDSEIDVWLVMVLELLLIGLLSLLSPYVTLDIYGIGISTLSKTSICVILLYSLITLLIYSAC